MTLTGRIRFDNVDPLYRRALATVLLAPDRYAASGQFTQRTFEAVLAGCLPLGPACLRGVETIVPPALIVRDGAEVIDRITKLTRIVGTSDHVALIADSIARLDPFRLSRQLHTLTGVLKSLRTHAEVADKRHHRVRHDIEQATVVKTEAGLMRWPDRSARRTEPIVVHQ